jgi:hypothetical protein
MTPKKNYLVKTENAKDIPIECLLEDMGITVKKKGDRLICSSPMSEDKNPSFVIYPENTFYDWSTGIGGTSIDLVMNLYGIPFQNAIDLLSNTTFVSGYGEQSEIFKTKEKNKEVKERHFNPINYVAKDNDDIDLIDSYTKKRGLIDFGMIPAQYFTRNEGTQLWKKNLAIGFLHKDEYSKICGIKMRNIDDGASPRFSARGRMFYYELFSALEPKHHGEYQERVYLVESETSANSLFRFLKVEKTRGVIGDFIVLSFGGVTKIPKTLPLRYEYISDRRIIIDYDGDEKAYNERIKKFAHLNAAPIKLKLPKGEDLNSLILSNKIQDYESALLW